MTLETAKEHRTVSRITTMLEAVAAESNGLSLSALSTLLVAPKSSVHGLAKGLVATGYLVEHQGRYLIGPAVASLLVGARPTLVDTARAVMERLQRVTEETVLLCDLVGESVVYVHVVESSHFIRYSAPLRTRRPLYPTSGGKCFLAFMPEAKREAYLLKHFPQRSAAIRSDLTRVRETGIALNTPQDPPDVSAVASPIRAQGRVLASLVVVGPKNRMTRKLSDVKSEILAAAEQIGSAVR